MNVAKAGTDLLTKTQARARLVTQLGDNSWILRGGMKDDGILGLLYKFYNHIEPSDLASLDMFLDRRYNPEQPSTALQLTEETQTLWKVVKGQIKMQDTKTCLDATMTVLRDPRDLSVMLYNPIQSMGLGMHQLSELTNGITEPLTKAKWMWKSKTDGGLEAPEVLELPAVRDIIVPTSQPYPHLSEWAKLCPQARIHVSCKGGQDPNSIPEWLTKVEGVKPEQVRLIIPGNDIMSTIEDPLRDRIELIRVPDDNSVNELLLYIKEVQSLSCTDLYHGGYAEMDAMASWLCRVWFKTMKSGSHADPITMPFHRREQLKTFPGGIEGMERWVRGVLADRDVKTLVFNHGTPPLADPAEYVLLQHDREVGAADVELPLQLRDPNKPYRED